MGIEKILKMMTIWMMNLKNELGLRGSRTLNFFMQQTTLLKKGSLEREDLEAFTRVC